MSNLHDLAVHRAVASAEVRQPNADINVVQELLSALQHLEAMKVGSHADAQRWFARLMGRMQPGSELKTRDEGILRALGVLNVVFPGALATDWSVATLQPRVKGVFTSEWTVTEGMKTGIQAMKTDPNAIPPLFQLAKNTLYTSPTMDPPNKKVKTSSLTNVPAVVL